MAIVKAPLKTDAAGKCSRWRAIIFNPHTHRHEWHTVRGTERAAKAFEREQLRKLGAGTYVAKTERLTVQQVADAFMRECRARNRRTSTLENYRSVLERHVLPAFGPREVGTLRKSDVRTWLAEKLE